MNSLADTVRRIYQVYDHMTHITHHRTAPAPRSTDLLWGTALCHSEASHPHCLFVAGADPFLSGEPEPVLRSLFSPQLCSSQVVNFSRTTLAPTSSGDLIFSDYLCLSPKRHNPPVERELQEIQTA